MVLEILQKGCPKSFPKVVNDDLSIFALQNMDDPEVIFTLLGIQEKYFPDDSGVELPPEYCLLNGAVVREIGEDGLSIVDIQQCREIAMIDGQSLYMIPAAESSKIEKGFHKRTEKIEAALSKWFKNNPDDPNLKMQKNAARAFTGAGSFIVPMIAGLKPAGINVSVRNWRRNITDTTRGMMELFDYFVASGDLKKKAMYKGADAFVFCNARAVQRVIADNQELFAAANLTQETSMEEIMDKVLLAGDEDKLYKLIGLLLGFDGASVFNYKVESESGNFSSPKFPMKLWDIQYQVINRDTNPDYKILNAEYERLFAEIERLLQQGLSPLEVMKAIKIFGFVTTVQQGTGGKVDQAMRG